MRPSAYRKWSTGRLRILPPAEFDRAVTEGKYQEHRFEGFAVYTQITDYGYERVLDVVLLIGEGFPGHEAEVVDHLATFARQHDCAAVEALARKGLETLLFPLGFRAKKILLRKDISLEQGRRQDC